jgi:threonylcarbamoyladenosine tRNA methylthiotransferase MtaB
LTAPQILTFGCRLNIAESEVMRGLAADAGLGDTVIVNSCAVTAEAERQTRQAIRKARRDRPDARIIVTGCAAQLHPEVFAAMPEVSRVLGNREKLDPAAWRGTARVAVGAMDAAPARQALPTEPFPLNTRGFVQVQQGCDHRCTFCIIPYARGPSRSQPTGAVADRVAALVAQGHREVVLTGVDLTAWGGDLPGTPRLGQLVRRLLALVPELPRLRLSSLDPAEMDEELWRLIGDEKRLMPHLHFSAQSGDDLVLKQMKRRHGRAQLLEAAARARALRPGVALGADLIAGFPTESEEQFERSLDLVEAAGLHYLHVFGYSPRAGTPAARLAPLPGDVVAARARRLRAAGAAALARRMAGLVGRTASVLMERDGTGRTECSAKAVPSAPLPAGEIVRLRLTEAAGDHLRGEVA